MNPSIYGRSLLGAPLANFRPSQCMTYVFQGRHCQRWQMGLGRPCQILRAQSHPAVHRCTAEQGDNASSGDCGRAKESQGDTFAIQTLSVDQSWKKCSVCVWASPLFSGLCPKICTTTVQAVQAGPCGEGSTGRITRANQLLRANSKGPRIPGPCQQPRRPPTALQRVLLHFITRSITWPDDKVPLEI